MGYLPLSSVGLSFGAFGGPWVRWASLTIPLWTMSFPYCAVQQTIRRTLLPTITSMQQKTIQRTLLPTLHSMQQQTIQRTLLPTLKSMEVFVSDATYAATNQ